MLPIKPWHQLGYWYSHPTGDTSMLNNMPATRNLQTHAMMHNMTPESLQPTALSLQDCTAKTRACKLNSTDQQQDQQHTA
jgi:hypothetical protein